MCPREGAPASSRWSLREGGREGERKGGSSSVEIENTHDNCTKII